MRCCPFIHVNSPTPAGTYELRSDPLALIGRYATRMDRLPAYFGVFFRSTCSQCVQPGSNPEDGRLDRATRLPLASCVAQKLVPEEQPRNTKIKSAETATLITMEPRQPSRFEKKKNT